MVAFSATADDGEINIAVEEVAFGPLPIPDSALESATDALNEMIRNSTLAETDEVTITDIQIGEGEITLTGQVTPP
jgi:hypothetical protein